MSAADTEQALALHDVRIAHASFWYVDAAGAHRWALKGDHIAVSDEDFERGAKHGAFVVDEKTDADLDYDPKTATIDEVLAFVGVDRERAVQALDFEEGKGKKARPTLVAQLSAIIDVTE